MFNANFPLKNVMDNCRIVLGEQEQEFEEVVSGNIVMLEGECYVQPFNFSMEKVVKRSLNRSLEKIPNSAIVE